MNIGGLPAPPGHAVFTLQPHEGTSHYSAVFALFEREEVLGFSGVVGFSSTTSSFVTVPSAGLAEALGSSGTFVTKP